MNGLCLVIQYNLVFCILFNAFSFYADKYFLTKPFLRSLQLVSRGFIYDSIQSILLFEILDIECKIQMPLKNFLTQEDEFELLDV